MWNFLLGLGTGASLGKTKTARRFVKPLLALFLVGVVVCGFIYAFVVLKAVNERNQVPNVRTHHSR